MTKLAYFGTDGIRGPVTGPLLQPHFVRRLGAALGKFLGAAGKARPVVILGRDTRSSGEALSVWISDGLRSVLDVEIWDAGIVPTPAVALAVAKHGADLGIVLTASHNPASDNGIKLFAPGGLKLTPEQELEIEAILSSVPLQEERPSPAVILFDALGPYRNHVSGLLEDHALSGWRVVVDTAHGATTRSSPDILRRWGAEVVHLFGDPDGDNINTACGSEHPEAIRARVRQVGAHLGLAHDGDGDRGVLIDETGEVVDGDQVLGLLALHALRQGKLANRTLVVTVASNLGLDRALEAEGGRVERVAVGDRNILHALLSGGHNLGGEASGHIILRDFLPSGDGMIAAAAVLNVMRETGKPLSVLRQQVRLFPQSTRNLRVREKIPLEALPELRAAVKRSEAELGTSGRVLVRYSGTEPKLRLLVEAPDDETVRLHLSRLTTAAQACLSVVDPV